MADPIFQQATVTKGNFYSWLKSLLTSNGWTNVSSNPTTDYDVFTSAGTDGTRNLVIQMRDGDGGTTKLSATNYTAIQMRQPKTYTPGVNGASGTFGYSSSWGVLEVIPSNTVTTSSNLTVYYNCNANRCIVVVQPPTSISNTASVLWFGLPEQGNFYMQEPNSVGLVLANNNHSGIINGGGYVWASDNPVEYVPATGNSTPSVYTQLAPRNPNSAGNFLLSDIFYGDATVGLRGKLSGVYMLPNQGVSNLDTLTLGSSVYTVFILHTGSNGSYSGYDSFASSAVIAVRTA